MKSFLFFISLIFCFSANSQISMMYNGKQYLISQTSIVRDEEKKQYQYNEWLNMLTSGEYDITPDNMESNPVTYKLVRLSKEEQASRLERAPKPIESKAFKGKKKIEAFEAVDINGQMVNTKSFKGKILVLNFWFIKCPPCRMERPYLNKLVEEYAADTNVVFVAVSLDPKFHLDTFLVHNPFKYRVIPDGMPIAQENAVEQYPTHVILDKEGKIAFNSVSYNAVTGYWMRKTIEELKRSQ